MTGMAVLVLLRHGETEWSRDGLHTGRTDVPLTPRGEDAARALAAALAEREVALTVSSPLERAVRTAQLAGLSGVDTDQDLLEWDYGAYEGLTTPQIRTQRPGWWLWKDGVPPGKGTHPGETAPQVGERTDRVLDRVRAVLEREDGDVVLVAHGHLLRVLTARWLGLAPTAGALFRLDTATLSTLGYEHERPVIVGWNIPAPPSAP
jgi:broad specificity phosphatase PhoE